MSFTNKAAVGTLLLGLGVLCWWGASGQERQHPVQMFALPYSGPAMVASASVGTTAGQVFPASPAGRVFLKVCNESTTASVAIAFGTATPALNAGGSFTLPSMPASGAPSCLTWHSGFVPNDAINAVASAAATPVTLEIQ